MKIQYSCNFTSYSSPPDYYLLNDLTLFLPLLFNAVTTLCHWPESSNYPKDVFTRPTSQTTEVSSIWTDPTSLVQTDAMPSFPPTILVWIDMKSQRVWTGLRWCIQASWFIKLNGRIQTNAEETLIILVLVVLQHPVSQQSLNTEAQHHTRVLTQPDLPLWRMWIYCRC